LSWADKRLQDSILKLSIFFIFFCKEVKLQLLKDMQLYSSTTNKHKWKPDKVNINIFRLINLLRAQAIHLLSCSLRVDRKYESILKIQFIPINVSLLSSGNSRHNRYRSSDSNNSFIHIIIIYNYGLHEKLISRFNNYEDYQY
jgi:hypothetical protein